GGGDDIAPVQDVLAQFLRPARRRGGQAGGGGAFDGGGGVGRGRGPGGRRGGQAGAGEAFDGGVRVGVEGGPGVAGVTGPPADGDLLGVHRVAHDEVGRRWLGGAAGEEVDGEVERSPPGVHWSAAATVGCAEGGEYQRDLG